jgi:NAD(P)-dependent dehydrogenase (short-subunit alcohol dehydrogenase family)
MAVTRLSGMTRAVGRPIVLANAKGRDVMQEFTGRFAVVTGGGTGMGRELARQLAAEGCNVAMCDVSQRNMAETVALIERDRPPQGTRVTGHLADVSDESQLIRFRREFEDQHQTEKLHLLFNNAGIGGGGSMIADSREEWERTFNVCWGGVYLGVRTFLPLMQAAEAAHIVNTSSVNGFWASLGPNVSHTAYAAAKFAVKGFTEALVTDLRRNAPHIKASVVMPGHIGTSIVANSRKVITGRDEDQLDADDLARARARIARAGVDVAQLTDQAIQALAAEQHRRFLEEAPTTAA